MKVTIIPIVIGVLGTIPKELIKGLEDLEIKGRRDHPDYSISRISQNTEKSPGDLRIFNINFNEKPIANAECLFVWLVGCFVLRVSTLFGSFNA